MNLDQFTAENAPTASDETFQRENSYTLDVDVDGTVMAKAGSMVAYTGDISFTGKASAEGGITGFLKEAATGEGTPIMSVEGEGHVYFADDGKKVQVVELGAGESITVNGEDVLAFEESLSYEISTIDSLAGAFAGGFSNVYLEGPGWWRSLPTAIRSSWSRRSRPTRARPSRGAVPPRTWKSIGASRT